jgi:hypothetical protein
MGMGIVLDTSMLLFMVGAATWGNSLSMLAEVLRGIPLIALECV